MQSTVSRATSPNKPLILKKRKAVETKPEEVNLKSAEVIGSN